MSLNVPARALRGNHPGNEPPRGGTAKLHPASRPQSQREVPRVTAASRHTQAGVVRDGVASKRLWTRAPRRCRRLPGSEPPTTSSAASAWLLPVCDGPRSADLLQRRPRGAAEGSPSPPPQLQLRSLQAASQGLLSRLRDQHPTPSLPTLQFSEHLLCVRESVLTSSHR